jgi:AGCS family alanine or glycine:cation symporter
MDSVLSVLQVSSDILWGPWTPWVLLAAGVLFTIWTKFSQYTVMTHGVEVIRGVYDNPDDPGAINHFQALSAALSATVGLGNIGGVAIAIAIGGPGALFWMWIVGFFGMALKTIEITLGMMYRNTDDPENPHGGAMWVVDRVIGGKGGIWRYVGKTIGVFFCITLVISTFTGGNMFQSWNVSELTHNYFGIPTVATGIVMSIIVGMVIIGGIKRIGQVAGSLVPLMCLLYLLSALAVLAMHITDIPSILKLIVTSAFSPTEASGAFLGSTVGFAFMEGMKRSLFSNEAGQGSSPIAHAAAKTNESAREGIVGGIGPFIDTIVICTLTALVIISTGTWNREAIGNFNAPLTLVRDNSKQTPTWLVQGSTEVKALPSTRFDTWKNGSYFYMIARVSGATHLDSNRELIQVRGQIVEQPVSKSKDAPPRLVIEWQPVSINPDRWIGQPTALQFADLGVHANYDGAVLTSHAFDRQFPGLGKWLVTLAAWLFAISTMISWSYYGEQGMIYMLGPRSVLPYKIAFLFGIIYAAAFISNKEQMILFMDLGTGAMLWANIPIVLCLGYLAVGSYKDYMRKLKAGEFPKHDKPDISNLISGKNIER